MTWLYWEKSTCRQKQKKQIKKYDMKTVNYQLKSQPVYENNIF